MAPTYTWTLARILALRASKAAAGKHISFSETCEELAQRLSYQNWSAMKANIASSTDPEALARMAARGPREPMVDGSINTKIMAGALDRPAPISFDLETDDAWDIVNRIQRRISKHVVMEEAMESKLYWLLCSVLRPLVYLRKHEALPITFADIRSLLPLNDFLAFAKELVDSDLPHEYVNPVLRYEPPGSKLPHGNWPLKASVEEHAFLAGLISTILHIIEIETKNQKTDA